MNFRNFFITILLIIFSLPTFAKSEFENDNALKITPLMFAVMDGDVDGVEFFTKFPNQDINERNIGGASALSLAARRGEVEIANILINAGADVNTIDNEGWSPLMRAAAAASSSLVDILIKNNADVTKLNKVKESAIIQAANADCTICLGLILAKFDLAHGKTSNMAKLQLADAFLIAKNHENSELQNLISSYLDKILAIENESNNKVFLIKDVEITEKNSTKNTKIKKFNFIKNAPKQINKRNINNKKRSFKLAKGKESEKPKAKKYIFKPKTN